jgi:hypothetical protein
MKDEGYLSANSREAALIFIIRADSRRSLHRPQGQVLADEKNFGEGIVLNQPQRPLRKS